ncbi:MAG: DNA-3-methyladenine glycosylase [Planctomycetota bacterium]|nr:MAG: DNA-3-methyladenine glycosylase [Planctomycetota bacterium]
MTAAPEHPSAAALRRLRASDPALAAAMKRCGAFPGFPEPARARGESHFGALGRAILFQQLAGKAAATIHKRVCALTPGPRFPRPQDLLALPEGQLRAAGASGAKQAALIDLAEHVLDGRLRLAQLARRSDEEIIDGIIQVRGLGVWSAQMFLMFRLGRLDVLPGNDLGIQEGLRRLDGLDERPRPADVLARGERWAPLRSVAAWTLWRLTELSD